MPTDKEKLDLLKKKFPHFAGFGADCVSLAQGVNAKIKPGEVLYGIDVPREQFVYQEVQLKVIPFGPWIQIIQLLDAWVVQMLTGCIPPAPTPTPPTPAQNIQSWITDLRPLHRVYIRSNVRRRWREEGGLLRDRMGFAVDHRLSALRGPSGLRFVQSAVNEHNALNAVLRGWK